MDSQQNLASIRIQLTPWSTERSTDTVLSSLKYRGSDWGWGNVICSAGRYRREVDEAEVVGPFWCNPRVIEGSYIDRDHEVTAFCTGWDVAVGFGSSKNGQ